MPSDERTRRDFPQWVVDHSAATFGAGDVGRLRGVRSGAEVRVYVVDAGIVDVDKQLPLAWNGIGDLGVFEYLRAAMFGNKNCLHVTLA